MTLCDWCKRQFIPIREGHRFCSMGCHDNWHVLNRRQAMEAWREMQGRGSLFFAQATTSNESDSEIQPAKRRAV
jgi:hypothetical protein